MSKFAHLSFTKIHAFTPCNNSTGYLLSQDILISSNYERCEVFMARSGVGSNRDIRQALSRAMIKPLKVTKNLGEMIVKGTLRDYASSELPALSGLFEENSELISQITNTIKNPKGAISKVVDNTNRSDSIQTVRKIMSAAVDDLRTGKFYMSYRDRDNDNSDLLDDFGGFDFSGFDDNGDWSESDGVTSESDAIALDIAAKQEESTDRRTEATIAAIGTATDTTNRTQLAIHKEDIKSAMKRHAQTITSLNNITTMTAAIHETMNNHLTAMTAMSREMHNNMMTEITSIKNILTEIRDHQIPKKQAGRRSDDSFPINEFTGALDFKKYFKYIGKQFADNTGLSMLTSMTGMLDSGGADILSQNPLQLVTDVLFRAIMPKSTKKKLSNLDSVAKGFFPSLLNRLYNYGENSFDDGIAPILARFFGIQTPKRGYIDPSQYNKDRVDFTGKVAKAITEVMPSQLSKIISLLSGEPMRVYNYDTGKFVDAGRAFAETYRRQNDHVSNMYDSRSAFMSRINSSNLKISNAERKNLQNAAYQFLQGAADESAFINPENLDEISFGNLSFSPADPFAQSVLYSIVKSLSHKELSDLNREISMSRLSKKGRMDRIQKDLESSGLLSLYNGISMTGEQQRRLGSRAMESDRSISSMTGSEYSQFMGDRISKYKPAGLQSTLSSILNTLDRGIIVYSHDIGTDQGGYKAVRDAQLKALKNFGYTSGGTYSTDTISDEQKRKDTRSKFREEFTGKLQGDIDESSSTDEMIKAFMGAESETVRIYENEKDQKAYEEMKRKQDAIRKKAQGPVEAIRGFFRKPFDLIERAVGVMDRAAYRIVYGDDAAKLFSQGDDSDHSLIASITTMMKANLGKFSDWFKETVIDKFVTGEDAPFKKTYDQFKTWTFDKAKGKAGAIRDKLVGIQNADGQYEGGKFSNFVNNAKNTAKKSEDLIKNQMSGFMDVFKDKLSTVLYGEEWHQQVKYENGKTIKVGNPYKIAGKTGIVGMFRDAGQKLKDFLFGTDENSESKQLFDKVKEETKKALPGAGAGAVMGGVGTIGAGLLTGLWLPGGPIFGAMLGSAAGFIGASDTLKNYLFGPAIDPTDPSKGRRGGIIEKNVQDAVKQYAPKVITGAGIGAIAGNFGLLPAGLGPVAGAAIGSFGGMIGANKELRELLFGNEDDDDSGYISKNTRKKMARALPGAITGGLGVNAIVGSMSGMGLLPSLLTMPGGPIVTALGATAGVFAGPKMEKFFFGEKDENGRWIPGKEGVFGKLFNFGKKNVFDPFFNRINSMAKGIGKWFEGKIMDPLREALDPIKKELKEGGGFIRKAFRGFGNILKGAIDHVFEKAFGKSLSSIAEGITKKAGQLLNFVTTSIGKAVGAVIASPFTLLRAYGRHLSKKQKKREGKRYRAWLKDHPFGTEEEFAEYERSQEGFSIERMISDAMEKADKKKNKEPEPGSSADNPIVSEEDMRKQKNENAAKNFDINEKAMKQNDKVNPPNSAETRSATALEKIEDKVKQIGDFIMGRRNAPAGENTGAKPLDEWTEPHAGDNMGSQLRGQGQGQGIASALTPNPDDPALQKQPIANGYKKRKKFSWTGDVKDENGKVVARRESREYNTLYRLFNRKLEGAKNPKEVADSIITGAPADKQAQYSAILKDVWLLNADQRATGGMAGEPTKEKDSGTSLFDLLSSHTGLVGGIAGLLLSMLGGSPGNLGAILGGVIGAKVLSKVIKVGKGLWDFGKKAAGVFSKVKNFMTYGMNPAGLSYASAAGGLLTGGGMLLDDDDKNDSTGLHNIYNVFRNGGVGLAKKGLQELTKPGSRGETLAIKGLYALDKVKGAAKGAGSMVKKAVSGVANSGAASTLKNVGSKIVQMVKKGVDKIVNSKVIQTVAGKFSPKLKEMGAAVVKFVGEHTPKLLKQGVGKSVKSGLKQLSSVLTGGVITAAFGVYDFISGMGDAYRYFEISPSDTTTGMKLCAGFCKTAVGLLSCVPIVGFALSLLPVGPLAQILYKIIADDDQVSDLIEKQNAVQAEVDAYNEANGTDLSADEYLKQQNEEEGGFWNTVKGLAGKVSDFFTGKGGYVATKKSNGKYSLTNKAGKARKPPSGYSYTSGGGNYYITESTYKQMLSDGYIAESGSGRGRGRWGRGNTIYDQTDPKWNAQDSTIKDSGCGPTVAAMMAERLGRGPDPAEASQMAYAGGYRDADGGTDPRFFTAYGRAHGVNMTQGPTDAKSIGAGLANGPVALMGQGGAFGSGSHYMLADSINGGSVSLIDPIGGKKVSSSLSSLANKTTAAIYGTGRHSIFGRGNNGSAILSIDEKAGNRKTKDQVARESAQYGIVVKAGKGRRFGIFGRGSAKEQAVNVMQIAENEVGYLEKASNANLNEKKANAGNNNWTKYGEWYGLNGGSKAPWCAMFVSWCLAKAGVSTDIAPKTAAVIEFTNFFKNKNAFHKRGSDYTPQTGDIIIFGSSGSTHTGLVYSCDGTTVTTIEGNTNGQGAEAEGNGVYKKVYQMSNSWIYGYCTPAYDGKTVSFSGDSGDSSDESDEESATPTGLARIVDSLNKKLNPLTEAIEKVSNPLTERLNKILGNSSGSSSDDSDDNSSSSGGTINGATDDSGGTLKGGSSFPKYTLSDSDKKFIAGVSSQEQNESDISAQRLEVSQMANLNEVEYNRGSTGAELLQTLKGGWYAKNSLNRGYSGDYSSQAMQAVEEVLEQGKRTLPRHVTEHDYYGDINNMDLNPSTETGKKNRKNLKPGTLITNTMGAKYQFYKFAGKDGAEGYGDPFGSKPQYIVSPYTEDVPWGSGRGRYGRGRTLNGELTSRTNMLNEMFGRGRAQAEQEARVDVLSDTIQAYGKGSNDSANSEVLSKMLDLFQQIVPILKNIETNTASSATVEVPSAPGRGPDGRNSVKKAQPLGRVEPTAEAGSNRNRLGSIVSVGTTSIDKITRR